MTGQHSVETFVKDLQALWSAEKQLTEAMPAMIEKATNFGLKKNLALHFAETDQQKEAIRGFCVTLGYPHEVEENKAVKMLVDDGEKAMATAAPGEELDAVIIESAIQIEHFEIGQYPVVIEAAKALGYQGIAARLAQSLEEERQADAKLNFLKKYLVLQTADAGAPDLALK